jgi:hypothetical protein
VASIIKIKRSGTAAGAPSSLKSGELAYTYTNGVNRLYFGKGDDGSGNATSVVQIGGEFYTDLLSATAGTVTASKAVIVDANKKVDEWNVDNIKLDLNTISTTNENGALILDPNGSGLVQLYSSSDSWTLPKRGTSNSGYVLTNNGDGTTSWAAAGSTLTIKGDGETTEGITLLTETLSILGGTGIDSTVGTNSITISIDSTVATLTGIQTLTNKTLTSPDINGGTADSLTSLSVRDKSAAYDLIIASNSDANLTGDRTLTIDVNNANRKIDIGGDLTLGGAFTTSGASGVTLTSTGTTNVTLPTTGTLSTLGGIETLTNKTITAPDINGGTADSLTSFSLRDTAAAFDLFLTSTSNGLLSANRTLTIDVSNADRTIDLAGNLSIANNFTTSGNFALTLTTTASTNVTLPTTGTLATLAGTEVLTNKTIDGSQNTITNVSLTTGITGTLPVANGGTGTTTGSITGTGALTFTAGGTDTNVTLVPNGTGTVDVSNKRITSVATPTQSSDAATKGYVDAVKTGLDPKDSVRLATTTELAATYNNGTSGVGATLTNSGTQAALLVDGVPAANGDRVLVKNQSTATENGIYVATDIGSGSSNWVLTRATDFDTSAKVTPGAFTFVEEGNTQADSGFVMSADGAITIGASNITFVQFSGAGQIDAGDGLTKTGSVLSVNVDNSTIEIASDILRVKDAGVTYAKIQNADALSVLGRAANTSGSVGAITAGADYNILRRSGSTVGFGAVDLSQAGAVGTSVLGEANGGTGESSYTRGDLLVGDAATGLTKLTLGSAGKILQSNGTDLVYADIDGGTY